MKKQNTSPKFKLLPSDAYDIYTAKDVDTIYYLLTYHTKAGEYDLFHIRFLYRFRQYRAIYKHANKKHFYGEVTREGFNIINPHDGYG